MTRFRLYPLLFCLSFLYGCGDKLTCSSESVLKELQTTAAAKFFTTGAIPKPLSITVSDVVTKAGDKQNAPASCTATLKFSFDKNLLEGVSKFYSDDDYAGRLIRYSPSFGKLFTEMMASKFSPLEIVAINANELVREQFFKGVLTGIRGEGPETINLQEGILSSSIEYGFTSSEEKAAKGKPVVSLTTGKKLQATLKIYGFVSEAKEPMAIHNAVLKLSSMRVRFSELIYGGGQLNEKVITEAFSEGAPGLFVKPDAFQSGTYLDYGGALSSLPHIQVHWVTSDQNINWVCAVGGYDNYKVITSMGCIYLPDIKLTRPTK